jgi:DUF1365 family protein
MKSSLYECRVMHHRFAPKAHHFSYRIFLFAIDLDELESLSRRLAFFSVDRANLYSFRDRDYLPTGEALHNGAVPAGPAARGATGEPRNLKARVVEFLAARGVDLAGGRVLLVTLPRIFGYGFNPVSFYFCYDRAGQPVAALAEVTNTFREMKPYYLGPENRVSAERAAGEDSFRRRMPKDFYVSPYSDVDVAFDFDLRAPGGRLFAQIDDFRGSERTLTSTVVGEQRELTGARLAWWTLKYPLLTLRVITLIHWHALQLWLKRLPWFSKAARAGEQRDLYRPHASIAQPAEQP